MEPVAEGGIIIILLHQHYAVDGQHRPLDCLVPLQTGKVLVGIDTGVLICRICQHQLFDHGGIMPVYLLDGRVVT